jgi:translocation and assembly module TamB
MDINAQGWRIEQALVTLAGGVLAVQGSQNNPGKPWQLQVRSAAVALAPMNIPQRGAISGLVTLTGPHNRFRIDTMSAQGDVSFSEGISLVHDPLRAQFTWSGKTLQVHQATADRFSSTGKIAVDLTQIRHPKINELDLQVQLADYDLRKLPIKFPPPVEVAAGVDFQGRLTGTIQAPWIEGNVQTRALTVNQRAFDPRLVGVFRMNPDGSALRLQGPRDFIDTRLDRDHLPHTATIQWHGGQATLQRSSNNDFAVELDRFPVAALGLELPAPQIGEQPLVGTASGSALATLKPSFIVAGNLLVNQPGLGDIRGQHLTTAFRLADGNLTVQNGILNIGQSRFQFDGRALLQGDNPSYQLNLAIGDKASNGTAQVGDFLQAFRWFDLIDLQRGFKPPQYDGAAAITLASVGLPDQPLQYQLSRFSEIKNQVIAAVRRQQASQKLPSLRNLAGTFQGKMAVSGTLKTGLNATFNFQGNSWRWGRYHANAVEVAGDFKNQHLTLQPVRLTLNDQTQINFQGILGASPQYGTLSIKALPLSLARDFVDLPLNLTGAVDLSANLAGSVNDPQLVGELNLLDATLNGSTLKTEKTGFNYSNRRLSFGGTLWVATGGKDPVEVSGEIPTFRSLALTASQGKDTEASQGEASNKGASNRAASNRAASNRAASNRAATPLLQGRDLNRLRRGDTLVINGEQATVMSVTDTGENRVANDPTANRVKDTAANYTSITLDRPLLCGQSCTLTVIPRLQLRLDVANEGIKVLNLLSPNKLIAGTGSVKLVLKGTVAEPNALGTVEFKDASVAAQFLPDGEAITHLNGRINFKNNEIVVEQLAGRFSEGEVSAQGAIGLATPLNFSTEVTPPNKPDITPLALSFQNLRLNIPGRYRGGADGNVQILGTALAPMVTGTINVDQGKVTLPDPSSVATPTFSSNETSANSGIAPLIFQDLNLKLGNNITIAADPLYNFKATGSLLLQGELRDLRPQGTIKLTQGQVNLFTTNFLLERGAKNTAVFSPNTGLNPNLDIAMVASVTEISNRRPTAGPVVAAEISDTNNTRFSELQTVRIRASVNGPASDILKNLRLTSRPARTSSELYSLMGGGFINTLGQGGNSTLALANLAGSALLNNLQAALNSVLRGPIDFRLFPLVVESQNRKENSQNTQEATTPGAKT